jgi:hypothetical protein
MTFSKQPAGNSVAGLAAGAGADIPGASDSMADSLRISLPMFSNIRFLISMVVCRGIRTVIPGGTLIIAATSAYCVRYNG